MPSKRRTLRLLIASLALLTVAVVLLILSTPPAPTSPGQSVVARPSPPWNLFPTRAVASPTATITPIPTATPLTDKHLRVMQVALLYDAPEVAEAAWEAAKRVTPEDSALRGHVLREGARLALLYGDLDTAEARAWDAVRAAAKDADTWALLGVILARQGESEVAASALSIAESLNPGLAPDIFSDRWRTARQSQNSDLMMALAQTYSSRDPENPLGFYYRAAALLASGEVEAAFRHLRLLLQAEPDSAAVLWYALGETYLAQHAYKEALTVFDVAEARFAAGDQSLYLASDDPLRDINLKRGLALVGLYDPERCTQAEALLRRWNAPDDAINSARLCQTPTPTLTPWIPVQIGTATPQF